MAKKLVRYLLEGNGTVPMFIESGGYYPIGHELIGLSVDEEVRHVPASVYRMTRADLLVRMQSMSLSDRDGNLLSQEQIEDQLDAFLASIDLSDLA